METTGTDRAAELGAAYHGSRRRLIGIAYAVLGSHSEAEDVVSECWLRLVAADRKERVQDVDAWSTVVVARAALDVLRSARKRREVYTGPWLPEPRIELLPAQLGDPADRVTLDDSVGYALLVVLETLSPAERTAWVLHDLFGMSFTDVAATVGRTPAAVRQLASRARAHVNERRPRVEVSDHQHAVAVKGFLDAATGGDIDVLLRALDPDVVLTSDGGGHVTAARHPVVGAEKVARFIQGLHRQDRPDQRVEAILVNGQVGAGVFVGRTLTTAVAFTLDDGRITRIDIVRAPDKLPPAV